MYGIRTRLLKANPDRRGSLTEIYRHGWHRGIQAKQINLTTSHAGSLRGTHLHRFHSDVFILAAGRAWLGMKDVRKFSPTYGETELIEMSEDKPESVIVPVGVVHGIHFVKESILVTVESEYYDTAEEIRVQWNDPELGIPWMADHMVLSDEDAKAQSYAQLMVTIDPWQEEWAPPLPSGSSSRSRPPS